MVNSSITILHSHEINEQQWNDCVYNSNYGLIYSTTTYLNTICPTWKGLVLNNYEAVVALPYRKKFGISYLYTPPFIQQLGIIGNYSFNDGERIYKTIATAFWYGSYLLNFENAKFPNSKALLNFILPLNKNYNTLLAACTTDFKSRCKKFETQLHYVVSNNIETLIEHYQQIHWFKTPHVSTNDFENFTKLCLQLQQQHKAHSRMVLHNNKIVAATVLFEYRDRLYNMVNFTNQAGKGFHANYFLFAQIIKEFCNSNYILDFEGSDIEPIAHFYKKMNPVSQPYHIWHRNVLKDIFRKQY
jgi:hypothetical protein